MAKIIRYWTLQECRQMIILTKDNPSLIPNSSLYYQYVLLKMLEKLNTHLISDRLFNTWMTMAAKIDSILQERNETHLIPSLESEEEE